MILIVHDAVIENFCKHYNRIKHHTKSDAKRIIITVFWTWATGRNETKKAMEDNGIESPLRKWTSFLTHIIPKQISCCFCRETYFEENFIAVGIDLLPKQKQ